MTIGVDFGTESGRVLLLDLRTGQEIAVVEVRYPHGVIDSRLPSNDEELPPDTALQDPVDYLDVLYRGIPDALAAGDVRTEEVIGIGIDFTACTVLPVTEDGTPLCQLDRWRDHPHAWVKLWKHHAAQPVADRLNQVAIERGEDFLARYGGRLSSEWYFPKLIETWQKDRAVFDAMSAFVEATDWIVWHLTGTLKRASCSAGYKACWSAKEGLPSRAFFEAAYPDFPDPSQKLGTSFVPPGRRAGTLRPAVAARLGLDPTVAVAVGNVDSFVAVPGAGVQRPGVFVMVVGHVHLRPRHRPTRDPDAGDHRSRGERHPSRVLRLRSGASGRRRHVRVVRGSPPRPNKRRLRRRRELVRGARAGRGKHPARSERARCPRLVEWQSDDPRRRRPLGGHRRPHARDHTDRDLPGACSSRWPSGRGGSSRTSSITTSPSPRWSRAAGSPNAARS